jgi:hypothetical protein
MEIRDTSNLGKISKMIDEEKYWEIISKSLKNSQDQIEQESFLINEISKLSLEEIIGFRLRTDKFLYDTYNSEMWCAGYILNSGCSDDGFEYFRNWVISRGKEVYYSSKSSPDSLINQVLEDIDEYDFESFWYVALEAFEKVTGKNSSNFIDEDNFKTCEGYYPDFDFNWEEDDPESMKKICPQLFEKLWK